MRIASLRRRLSGDVGWFATSLILQLADEMFEKSIRSASRIRIRYGQFSSAWSLLSCYKTRHRTCSFSRRKRLVRISAMLLLVDRTVNTADSSVEARLAEDLELCVSDSREGGNRAPAEEHLQCR